MLWRSTILRAGTKINYPALIFQTIILFILGIAGVITLLFNFKKYSDLTEKEDK